MFKWLSSDDDKSDRRLYVDMIFRKTKMYANYTPSSSLELGDYGDVSKEGEFIRSGNVFLEFPDLRDKLGQGREEFGNNKHFFVSRSRKKDGATVLAA